MYRRGISVYEQSSSFFEMTVLGDKGRVRTPESLPKRVGSTYLDFGNDSERKCEKSTSSNLGRGEITVGVTQRPLVGSRGGQERQRIVASLEVELQLLFFVTG